MRWAPMVVLTISLTAASPSSAFNEPDSFRGIPWRASEDLARVGWPELRCYTPDNPLFWPRLCSTLDPITVEGVPVRPTLGFRSNELVYASVTFDPAHFPKVERYFVERYGPPTKQEQEPAPSPAGAAVTNELRHWIGPKVSVTLLKYGPTLTEGRARFQFVAP